MGVKHGVWGQEGSTSGGDERYICSKILLRRKSCGWTVRDVSRCVTKTDVDKKSFS